MPHRQFAHGIARRSALVLLALIAIAPTFLWAQKHRSVAASDSRFRDAGRIHTAEIRFVYENRGLFAGATNVFNRILTYTRVDTGDGCWFCLRDSNVTFLFARDTFYSYYPNKGIVFEEQIQAAEIAEQFDASLWPLMFGMPNGLATALTDSTQLFTTNPIAIGDDTCLIVSFPTTRFDGSGSDLLDSARTQYQISFRDPTHSWAGTTTWTPVDSFTERCYATNGYYSDAYDARISRDVDSMISWLRHDRSLRMRPAAEALSALAQDTSGYVHVGDHFPSLELVNEDGVSADPFTGVHRKVTLVEIYHNSCMPVVESFKGISSVRDSLRALGGDVVAINVEPGDRIDRALNARMAKRFGRRFDPYYLTRTGPNPFFRPSYPTFMILDGDLRIISIQSGYLRGIMDTILLNRCKALLKHIRLP